MYATYEGIFTLGLLICAIISLVLSQRKNNLFYKTDYSIQRLPSLTE